MTSDNMNSFQALFDTLESSLSKPDTQARAVTAVLFVIAALILSLSNRVSGIRRVNVLRSQQSTMVPPSKVDCPARVQHDQVHVPPIRVSHGDVTQQAQCRLIARLPVEVRLMVYTEVFGLHMKRSIRQTDDLYPRLQVQDLRSRRRQGLYRSTYKSIKLDILPLLLTCRFV